MKSRKTEYIISVTIIVILHRYTVKMVGVTCTYMGTIKIISQYIDMIAIENCHTIGVIMHVPIVIQRMRDIVTMLQRVIVSTITRQERQRCHDK